MKARKLGKRLVFKKETVMNLGNQEMKVVQGGDLTDYYWCYAGHSGPNPCTYGLNCTMDCPTVPCTQTPQECTQNTE